MVRFLHTADWQLGMTRRFLSEEAQARYSQDRFDAVRRLLTLAADQDCAFVVVAGDVFDSNQVDRRTVVRGLEALGEARVPVYLLPGNHDPLDAASVYRSSAFREARPDRVEVLDDARGREVAPGTWLHGAPWHSKRPLTDLVADACESLPPADGTRRVLVAHGALEGVAPRRDDPALIDAARLDAVLADGRLHFVALGDRHSATRCPLPGDPDGAAGRVWYSGTPEPTAHDEVDPGKVLVVDLEEEGVEVTPHEVGRWSFSQQEAELLDTEDVQGLARTLEGFSGKERTALRLVLHGALRLADKVRLDRAIDDARDLFAGIEVWGRQKDLTVVPEDADFEGLGLAGFVAATVAALREGADGDDEAGFEARGALALLLSLTGREG